MIWSAPEIWPDEAVFIIGGGPSLKKVDLSVVHRKPVIGVNNAYELGAWVDVTFFGDVRWFDVNYKQLLAHPSVPVTCNVSHKFTASKRVKQLKKVNKLGLHWASKDSVCWNNNSGAAAINLALHLGAAKIVLLGFDMQIDKVNGYRAGHNWGEHHLKLNSEPLPTVYRDRFLPGFGVMASHIKRINEEGGRQVQIVNATEGGALETFERVQLEDVINE